MTGGGTWFSSNTTVATIGSTTGIVSGVTTGVTNVSYILPTGCATSVSFTVNPLPAVIAGSSALCLATSTILTDPTPGGYWTSSNIAIADIDAGTGLLTGVSIGMATITYTLSSSGCYVTKAVTVSSSPTTISGTRTACVGRNTTLVNGVGGGTWSSSATTTATVNPVSGVYTGMAAGIATMTYSLGGGCYATAPVTINPSPAPIGGTLRVCTGGSTTLTDATTGGVWSASSTSTVSIGSTTGMVVGGIAGTATITYTSGGCSATAAFTVNPLPAAITGTFTVCPSATTILGSATTGGTWVSSNTAVASIGSATGIATGAGAGVTNITYTLPTTCYSTKQLTVAPNPTAIVGAATVCIGATTTLTNGTAGGVWSKSNSNVNIGSTTGIVTGVTSGVATITYTLPTGCYATKTITVNNTSGAISGILQLCVSGTTTLTAGSTGGTWSSSTTTIATVGSTGVVTGVASGTATISYGSGAGCTATAVVTVNPMPAAITGGSSICAGATTTLSSVTTGGAWTSSTTSTAIVNSTSGLVTGVSPGTTTITYTAPTGCNVMKLMTINVNPLPITGPSALCVSATITESGSPAGGTWLSGTTTVATIGVTSGTIFGVTTGTTNITYTLPTGCSITKTVTVSPSPGAITGATGVCTGATTTLTNAVAGGWWLSSTTAVSIGSLSGTVTGVSAGVTTITYSLGTGCTVTRALTIHPSPAAISGASTICTGTTTVLTDATAGGVWSSSATSTATVNSASGLVSGVAAGATTITYTLPSTGCTATKAMTVNGAPGAIGGPGAVCVGAMVTESNATSGGTWSTAAATITVNSATGEVTGMTAGVATITYGIGSCTVTRMLTINPITAISGAGGLCAGTTTTLTNSTAGGTWTSGTTSVATIGSTGIVTGVSSGTATITYTIPITGCTATKTITVNSGPGAITGPATVCQTQTTALSNTAGGGTWSSSATGIATINSTSGIVTGVTGGVATITYSLGTGCVATRGITVNPQPGAITGPSGMCAGTLATLTSSTTGGRWTSSAVSVATVNSTSGLVTGVAAGSTTITYSIPATGCIATKTLTVNSGPGAITGTATVCQLQATALGNAAAGGTWTSGAMTIATINSTTGVVTGVAAGTATITYTLGAGCTATKTVTVYALPSPVTGSAILCIGNTTALATATTGGVWSSGATAVATIGSTTGVVSGITAGTADITYTAATGCMTTKTVTVNLPPAAIGGITTLCSGSVVTLSNITPGGVWSSGNPIVATIGSASGIVTGMTTGMATITYSTGSGCMTTKTVTVTPPAASITGSYTVCAGRTVTLSHATAGGTWSSGSTGIAAIGSTTATTASVTGVAAGTARITYTITAGCMATRTMTINGVAPISGATALCAWGDTVTVYDPTPGGSYSSTLVTITTLGGGFGRVTGFGPGTGTVTYTIGATGCSTTRTITVNPLPASITGSRTVCIGGTTTLANASPGGVWISGVPAIASAGSASGIISGIAMGTARITYTLPTGCKTDTPVTVIAPPAGITGWGSTVIIGTSTTYACATPGGTWSSSSTAIATIGSGSGIVTGRTAGVVTITYSLPAGSGCYSTRTLTVTPLSGLRQGRGGTITSNRISIYPNPNRGAFTIEGTVGQVAEEREQDVWLQVTDMHGREVYAKQTTTVNGRLEERVELTNIASGVYFVTVHLQDEVTTLYVVVER